MKEIALPVTSTGKQILDCDGDHVADCVSVEVAAFTVTVLNSHYELLEAMKTARSEIAQGLGLVNHKFERAGGILEVAHKGVELGAMSWASNVSNGLHNAGIAIETLTAAIIKAEGKSNA